MLDILLVIFTALIVSAALVFSGIIVLFLIPLLLVLCIVIFVLEFIGQGNIRRRWGRLQLPVHTLRHIATNKEVRLMGVMHIADTTYWTKLESYIQKTRKDGVVLFEGLKCPAEDELSVFTAKELSCYRRMQATLNSMGGEIASILGLQFQKVGLSYPNDWIRTDMTGIELIQALSIAEERIGTKCFPNHGYISPLAPEMKPYARWILQNAIMHFPIMGIISKFRVGASLESIEIKRIIFDMRNEIGVEGILKYGKSHNVISIWGAAHLTGMIDLLAKHGYEIVDTEWFAAWKPKSYSFVQALAESTGSRMLTPLVSLWSKNDKK